MKNELHQKHLQEDNKKKSPKAKIDMKLCGLFLFLYIKKI